MSEIGSTASKSHAPSTAPSARLRAQMRGSPDSFHIAVVKDQEHEAGFELYGNGLAMVEIGRHPARREEYRYAGFAEGRTVRITDYVDPCRFGSFLSSWLTPPEPGKYYQTDRPHSPRRVILSRIAEGRVTATCLRNGSVCDVVRWENGWRVDEFIVDRQTHFLVEWNASQDGIHRKRRFFAVSFDPIPAGTFVPPPGGRAGIRDTAAPKARTR